MVIVASMIVVIVIAGDGLHDRHRQSSVLIGLISGRGKMHHGTHDPNGITYICFCWLCPDLVHRIS